MRFLPQRGERHADQGRPQESGAFYGPVFGPVLQIKAQTAGLPAAARKPENGAQMAAPQRKFADMKILRMNWVRGPGVWTYRSIIEAVLDIGELEDFPSNTIPGYYERLTAWLPGLVEHKCGVGERGGFLQRLREGTWPGHVMEHVALELQMQAGMNTAFGKTRMTGEHAVYKVVIRAFDEAVGRLALESARDLVMAAINGTPYDVPAAIARLKALGEQRCFSAGTACIVDAALARGIPCIRLNESNLVQLGHGAAQRRIWATTTDRTSAIAAGISRDKDLLRGLLKGAGIPVPEGRVANSAEDAWEAAEDIGLPVTVKSAIGGRERGLALNLSTREQVMAAWQAADALGDDVIVEKFIPGHACRLLVAGGRVVAATRYAEAHSTQNGSDATSHIHPGTAALAALAVRVTGLDIAGVDLVAQDLAAPLPGQGVIVGVHAGPDLRMHLRPSVYDPPPVGEAIVEHLFPLGESGRIPIVGMLGGGASSFAPRLVSSWLHLHGLRTALACQEGLFLGARQLSKSDSRGYDAGERMLINRTVQAAVFETTPRHILAEGLPYDRCQVGVVLAMPSHEGLQEHYVSEARQMPGVARTQVDVVLPTGAAVLNADDPAVLALAEYSDGEVLLFSLDEQNPALTAHRARGGRVVFARPQGVVLAQGSGPEQMLSVPPSTRTRIGCDAPDDVRRHILAAVAAAWALNLPTELVHAGLLHMRKSVAMSAYH